MTFSTLLTNSPANQTDRIPLQETITDRIPLQETKTDRIPQSRAASQGYRDAAWTDNGVMMRTRGSLINVVCVFEPPPPPPGRHTLCFRPDKTHQTKRAICLLSPTYTAPA